MTNGSVSSSQERIPHVDTRVSHSARVWNYFMGGKDNYPVDREVGEQVRSVLPSIVDLARAQRGFLIRAVRYLAGEVRICLLYTSPSPRDGLLSRMPSSA